jgi:ABC-type antimicrobial peptide transport system permease subunit
LLAVHVAATIVVLIAAGLLVRAVVHGFGAGAGFDVDRLGAWFFSGFGLVALVLGAGVFGLVAYLAAWRLRRLSPAEALRAE